MQTMPGGAVGGGEGGVGLVIPSPQVTAAWARQVLRQLEEGGFLLWGARPAVRTVGGRCSLSSTHPPCLVGLFGFSSQESASASWPLQPALSQVDSSVNSRSGLRGQQDGPFFSLPSSVAQSRPSSSAPSPFTPVSLRRPPSHGREFPSPAQPNLALGLRS